MSNQLYRREILESLTGLYLSEQNPAFPENIPLHFTEIPLRERLTNLLKCALPHNTFPIKEVRGFWGGVEEESLHLSICANLYIGKMHEIERPIQQLAKQYGQESILFIGDRAIFLCYVAGENEGKWRSASRDRILIGEDVNRDEPYTDNGQIIFQIPESVLE